MSGDACDIWEEKRLEGRKDYVCAECHKDIRKGTEHVLIKHLYDGNWGQDRMCILCRDAWDVHIEHMLKAHGERILLMIGGYSEEMLNHTEEDCAYMKKERAWREKYRFA
jgi:hypothetical protein